MNALKRVSFVALAAALFFGVYAVLPTLVSRVSYAVEAGQAQAAGDRLAVVQDLSRAFKDVAKALKPSVVSISSVRVVQTLSSGSGNLSPFFNNSPLRDFFGDQFFRQIPQVPRGPQKQSGLGTGVIVSKDGYILTNNHVVADADELMVKLADDREVKAEVVGTDPKTDVALIKIDMTGLKPAPLGKSKKLEVGEWVLAMGSPFGLSQTITAGIVSATGRGNVGIVDYEDFIQTDAAINPGNSGGPLVNLKGEVVGINTAIFSRSGGYMGIGFAIPIDMAKQIMTTLREEGKVVRGYLGVYIQNLTEGLADSFGYEGKDGALVGRVQPGSPAADAGVKEGDIITRVAGKTVEDSTELRNRVAAMQPGSTVEFEVFRDGQKKTISVKIGELEGEGSASSGEGVAPTKLGMQLQTLSAELAQRLGQDPDLGGVVVSRVTPLSPADRARLQPGDIIIAVQGERVHDVAAFRRELGKHDLDKGVRLRVRRGDDNFFAVISTAR